LARRFLKLWPQLTAGFDRARIRDWCDQHTASALDNVRLNILTDMVEARIHKGWKGE
jgi:hypothetical protein